MHDYSNNHSTSKTSLFLMELIIVILFFAISASICVRFFVTAFLMEESSINISNASKWSDNIIETYKGMDGDLTSVSRVYKESSILLEDDETKTIIMFFDQDWNLVRNPIAARTDDQIDTSYELIATSSNVQNNLADLTIKVADIRKTGVVNTITASDIDVIKSLDFTLFIH